MICRGYFVISPQLTFLFYLPRFHKHVDDPSMNVDDLP